jgi:hypothetical protein
MPTSHSKLRKHMARKAAWNATGSSSSPSPQQKAEAWYIRTYLMKDNNGSQPHATKATDDACAGRAFLAAKRFDGSKGGYVFKNGPKGLGYYVDVKTVPNSTLPPAGSVADKAWKFVERVLAMVDEMSKVEGSLVQAVASDSMFYVAMRMLCAQQAFRTAGKPTVVDLGYHYTQEENMASIRSDGLMSSKEQATKRVSAVRYNGASYGQGVYTATNPCAWHGYFGDVGLIVARLQGVNVDFNPASVNTGNQDSVTVDRDNVRECVVLVSSQQCIPILQFDSSQISRNSHVRPGNMLVNRYHVALQALIDEMFNDIYRPAY